MPADNDEIDLTEPDADPAPGNPNVRNGISLGVSAEHDHVMLTVMLKDGELIHCCLTPQAATVIGAGLIGAATVTDMGMGRPPAGEKH